MWAMLDLLPVWVAVMLVATIGLAPLAPEPHVWEKLKMLAAGTLSRPIDIFDLFLHGAPWLLMAARLARRASKRA